MPRFLAIEWDDHQLRALVATTSGRSATIENAEAIDLPTAEGEDPPPETIGKTLADWVRSQGLSRITTLVAVGRASIELKRLALPPAPDNELPDLVRFQAQREFSSLSEESPLDFLPLSGDEAAPRQVLAAALSTDLLDQIRSVCDAAGLRAERIVLRPCATAAVVRQAIKADHDGAMLIVDPLIDEVDLTVLVGEKVVFIRTVRLPHVTDDERQYRPLLGELRRTIAAFHNQFREARISSVRVCGHPEHRAALAEAIEKEFELTTSVLHPLEAVGTTSAFRKKMPEHPGRYAPLVGMVLDEAASSHAIDFLNPRRKIEERTSRTTYVLAAAAALLLLGWYAWWQYDRISHQKTAIASLQRQITDTTKSYEESSGYGDSLKSTKERVDRVAAWFQSDVNWLAELTELSLALRPEPLKSTEFPKDQDAVATSLVIKAATEGGEMDYELAAKFRDLATVIQERIRSDTGDTLKADAKPEVLRAGYPWKITATERVTTAVGSAEQESRKP